MIPKLTMTEPILFQDFKNEHISSFFLHLRSCLTCFVIRSGQIFCLRGAKHGINKDVTGINQPVNMDHAVSTDELVSND